MSEWNWKGRGMEGLPTLATQHGEAHETRQEYANARIQYWQRPGMNPSWITLLAAFRMYGELYDRGARLRDEQMEGAA